MDEEVPRRFEPAARVVLKELPVSIRHIDKAPGISKGRIGGQGRISAVLHPALEGIRALASLQHHQLMIATQRHELSPALAGDEPVEHRAGIGTTIEVIPERDNNVLGLERHRGSQGRECLEAAMDVANCQIAHDATSRR
ncbi:MAG TPA: hypothetical protein VGY66_03360 [Gemmataceae bacterium]|jgi:hypothetical protein|nr:hypothetical protein [Gemmataceae bacterium]